MSSPTPPSEKGEIDSAPFDVQDDRYTDSDGHLDEHSLAQNDEDHDKNLKQTDGDEKQLHVETLGEGPSAPNAAAEAVAAQDKGVEEVDPGVKGWVCLLGAFLMNFIVYGMTNSFGVFQNYYVLNQLSTSSPSQISWIGSIQLCLTPLLGCISGPLFDAGYLHHLIIAGGSLYVFCMFMTSIAKVYWQFLLAHGIGVGLGMGIMFSPSVSTLSHHFGRSRYRSLAYGIQASGSAASGILLPILARNLLPTVGFAWTIRIFAFIVLAVVVAVFFCLSTVHPPRKEIAILSPSVFRNVGYCFHTAGAGCGSAAIYCPLTFSVTYGVSRGFSEGLANYSLAIINGASGVGRIVPVLAAQWVGYINIHASFAVTSAIMLFCWTRARDVPGVLAFDALYGVSSGAYAAAYNPAAASFAPCPNQVGLYIGMSFFVTSFFWLAGTPITAALIRGSNYLPASMFCGAIVGLGAAFLWTARFVRSKQVGSQFV